MELVKVEGLRIRGGTAGFEGADHGASASFFVVRSAPGGGADWHRHLYEKVFVNLGGSVARSPRTAGRRLWRAAPSWSSPRERGTGSRTARKVRPSRSIHPATATVQEGWEQLRFTVDPAGLTDHRLAVLPGAARFTQPGSGVIDHVGWMLEMVPAFLRSPVPCWWAATRLPTAADRPGLLRRVPAAFLAAVAIWRPAAGGLVPPRAGRKAALLLLTVALSLVSLPPEPASAADNGFAEEEIRFRSGEATLGGTVLVPHGTSSSDRKPAIALVHGAGPHTREDQRDEAEAFAREGVVALVYDKRTEGYSQLERSYGLLADDALAAVGVLRDHPGVDPDAVGLWGLSEGAWVVPIAASHPEGRGAVDFVVLVAATGVPPARQTGWNLENELRRQGVSGSMVGTVSRKGTRLLVGAGLFPGAHHDPVGPLRGVSQPVLALWGEKDRVQPPAESARIVQEALRGGGNDRYVARVFPDAEHGLRSSPDGFAVGENLAPGYARAVGTWVFGVAAGEAPGPSVTGPAPEQARPSRPLDPPARWESAWAQLGAVLVPVLAFASHPAGVLVAALARLLRGGRPDKAPPGKAARVRRRALLLSAAGTLALLGSIGYLGYLMFTGAGAVGPVALGRALPWLALQALAVATCLLAVTLGASWWSARAEIGGAERARIGILLAGSAVFAVWAGYWGLLVP